jgi:hypothetical protein
VEFRADRRPCRIEENFAISHESIYQFVYTDKAAGAAEALPQALRLRLRPPWPHRIQFLQRYIHHLPHRA